MKKLIKILSFISLFYLISCSEHYSEGNRVGYISKFSQKGVIWKTWEGSMSLSQTGYNGNNNDFEFSIDGDNQNQSVIDSIKYAVDNGLKIEVKYHQVWGAINCFYHRGETSYFVDNVTIKRK